jgi:CRP/FNR family transcriptional regulator
MRRNKAWFFRNNPVFEGFASTAFDRFIERAEEREYRKKRVLWSPGDPADRLFFVRRGIVKTTKVTDDGRELTLQFYTKNDLFGEVAVFNPGPHSTQAEAYEDVTLYATNRDGFLRLLTAHPELALRVSKIIAERRERLENRVGRLLFKTAHARLASLFLDLSEDFGVRDSRGVIINLKLTHKEMAALIGATRETVSFAILDLRRDGLILTESKRVVIVDEEGLRKLVHA